MEGIILAGYAKNPPFFHQLESLPPVDIPRPSLEKRDEIPSPISNDLEFEIGKPEIEKPEKLPKKSSLEPLSSDWSAVSKRIPLDEEAWQKVRQDHGLDTREGILLF